MSPLEGFGEVLLYDGQMTAFPVFLRLSWDK
jgi:hypothetical protein